VIRRRPAVKDRSVGDGEPLACCQLGAMSCSGSSERDRPPVVRLLRDTIVHLCRANAPFGGGRVEVDGIICITGSSSGQQLVVKVHEVLHNDAAVDQTSGPSYPPPGVFERSQCCRTVDHAATPAPPADVNVEAKRRRLDTSSTFDGLPPVLPLPPPSSLRPHQSALYDYLSRFGLSGSPRISAADFDSRFGVKDLSVKTRTATSTPLSGRRDTVDSGITSHTSPPRRPVSPPDSTGDTAVPRHQRPVIPPYAERWSPSRLIPAIPQCFVCGYRFSSAEALGEHNETVHSIFTCLCCFKTFTSRSNLERHSRLHTGHRPYSCPVCGKSFSRKDHLSNHATKHAYKCGTCTRRCSDRTALAEHYRLEHPGLALAAVCAYCNKGFSSVELYEEHVKVHPQFHVAAGGGGGETTADQNAPAVRHQCQMCGFEAMDRVCLVQHQQLMHYTPMSLLRDAYDNLPTAALQRLDQQQSYRCVVCGFTTTSLLALRQHEAAHVVYDVSAQAFASYSRSPRSSPTGESRGKEAATGAQGYCCEHCGQQFGTYAGLCQHIQQLSACAPADETLLVGSQHRDKRKQKQPKPVMVAEDEDEEVNVVSPRSADDPEKSEENTVERPLSDAKLGHSSDHVVLSSLPGDGAREIRMEPIRSIMNRSSLLVARVRDRPPIGGGSPSPPRLQDECGVVKSETGGSADVTLPRLLKRENSSATGDDTAASLRDLSNNSVADLASENSPSRHSSLDDLALHNNNNNSSDVKEEGSGAYKCESQWMMSTPMVEQTRCVVCGAQCADFSEMEAHCLTEHSRSPCMYCPKTFAQKANRDRHTCLHTGDRPYGCPECGERFSRGDKLKMHRVRTHGVLYPLYGSRQRDRDGASSSSRNHSTSQSPLMTLDSSEPAVTPAAAAAVFNGGGSAASQDGDSPPPPTADSDLHGSTSVLSGGEWIDLRISMCRESSKLQSALAGIASSTHHHQPPLETFPKRETTDDSVADGQQVHRNM